MASWPASSLRGAMVGARIAAMSVHVAILAGGRGERFWPLSRATRPKQVLNLVGDRSLLAATVERALVRASADHVWIVSSAEQRSALEGLSLPIPADRFLWEPVARNTAPAIGAAAALVHASADARGAASGAAGGAHEVSRVDSAAPGGSGAAPAASAPAASGAAPGASGAAPGASGAAHATSSAARGAVRAAGGDDALLLVLPADHWIPDVGAFWRSAERGAEVALSRDAIVTFGIPVTRPETGYGYIERGNPITERVFEVDRFHEKPTVAVAREYQDAGRFYWNAGIFLARPRVLLDEITRHIPQMSGPLESLQTMLRGEAPGSSQGAGTALLDSTHGGLPHRETVDRASFERGSIGRGSIAGGDTSSVASERVEHGYSEGWRRYFEECPSIAIDYGVLERSSNVVVVEAEFTWSDLGGWESWAELRDADSDGNHVSGELIAQDAHENIVLADPSHLVALLGVSNLIVIQTEDALLICPRDRAQEVRDLVKRGRADERWKDHF